MEETEWLLQDSTKMPEPRQAPRPQRAGCVGGEVPEESFRMILKLSKLDHPEKGAVIHKSSDLTDFYAFSHGIQRKRRQDHPRTTQIQAFEQVVFFSLFFSPLSSYQG